MIELKSYLQGKWQSGGGVPVELFDPATGRPVARTSTAGLDLVGALNYARTVGNPALRQMSFAARAELLGAVSKALREAREQLLDLSVATSGTTRSDAKFDVDGAIGTLAYYADLGAELGDRSIFVDGDAEKLARSPRFCGYHIKSALTGVALHINAFNFPAWGMAEKAACALLAGMPVISKPATSTALVAFRAMEAIVQSGALPAGAWQFIAGPVGDLVSALDSQDVLAFTGSAATARKLRTSTNVIERSVRLNVEADSINAAVLAPAVTDDSYQMFLRDTVREMTQKAGQKCTATRRLFVPADQLERVQSDLCERLAQIVIGEPSAEQTRLGPLATRAQLDEAHRQLKLLRDEGAKLVFGDPERVTLESGDAAAGCYFGPLLLRLDDPQNAQHVHQVEVFGPVATLMPYTGVEQAVALVARGGGGLVASLYSDDPAFSSAALLGLAPHHGRVFFGSAKVADVATTPGMVLPGSVHGGPGRAGGGEELGGLRGLDLYLQRTVLQGDRAVIERALGLR
ncbi:MAG: 3,4-dehydroadipyl-CoA semialdehyde dehydrogenase [Deltaproteobacteria bacterium]|nr:3,4-dehydroadipyl-CoA semialdehyde dehydrogenase [Deltaproteobacteria bacterium]